MNPLTEKNFISTKEASDLSGYNPDYLGRLCREGKLECVRVGRSWLISRESLISFEKNQEERKKQYAEELSKKRELEYIGAATQVPLTIRSLKEVQEDAERGVVRSPIQQHDLTLVQKRGVALLATFLVLLMGVTGFQVQAVNALVTKSYGAALMTAEGVHEIAFAAYANISTQAQRLAMQNSPRVAFVSATSSNSFSTVASSITRTTFVVTAAPFALPETNLNPYGAVVATNIKTHPIVAANPSQLGDAVLALSTALTHPLTIPAALDQFATNVTGGLLNGYSDAVYGFVDTTPAVPAYAFGGLYKVGDTLARVAASAPIAIENSYSGGSQIIGKIAYDDFATVDTATARSAAKFAVIPNTASALTHTIATVSTSTTKNEVAAVTQAPQASLFTFSLPEQIALATYTTIHNLFSNSTHAIIAVLNSAIPHGPAQLYTIPNATNHAPAIESPTNSSVGSSVLATTPASSTSSVGGSVASNNDVQPISGATQSFVTSYVDGQLAGLRNFVLNQNDALVRNLARSNNGVSTGGSTSISPTTKLTVASITAGNASLGDTSVDSINISGDATIGGTLTAGTLAVSGISSSGILQAPNFVATSTLATSSFAGNLSVGGNLTVGSLNGFLKATAGAISTSLIDLTTDVNGTLPVGNGGTGSSSFATNGVLYGNGTNGLLATSQGGPNSVLVANGGAPAFSNAITVGTSVTSPTINATGSIELNGVDITTSGTLSNLPYLAQNNVFTGNNTFANATSSALATSLFGLGNNYFTSLLGTGLTNVGNVLTVSLAPFTTSDLAEGSNLYFRTDRARNAISATAPLTYDVTNGILGITQASGAQNGYLSSADWNTFNNKVSTVAQTYGTGQTGALVLATSTGTYNGLTFGTNITNSGSTFTFTPTVSGSLLAAPDLSTVSTTLTGVVHANAGVLSASTVALGSEVSGVLTQANGGTGFSSYSPGEVFYTDNSGNLQLLPAGTNGQVLKVAGGIPGWGTDQTVGAGGSDGVFATSTGIIYPIDTTSHFVLGGTSTTTPSSVLEVQGQAYISNKLGIATTSPVTNLSVVGNGYLTGGLGVGLLNTVAGTLSTAGNALFGGNVGVGTTSPFTKLSVVGDTFIAGNLTATGTGLFLPTDTAAIKFINNGANGMIQSAGGVLTISDTAGTSGADNIIINTAGAGRQLSLRSDAIRFSNAGNSTEYARFTSAGNFGIGTTSPYAKLSVVGDVAITGGLYDSTATRGSTGQLLESTGAGVQWVSTTTLGLATYTGLSATAPLQYNSGTGVFSIPAATSFSDGYLSSTDWNTFNNKQAAITPGTGLSFSGATLNSVWTASGNNIFNNNTGNVGVGSSTPWATFSIQSPVNSPAPLFAVGSSTAATFFIQNNGFVSVGVAPGAVAQKLDVNGYVRATGYFGNSLTSGTATGILSLIGGLSSASSPGGEIDLTAASNANPGAIIFRAGTGSSLEPEVARFANTGNLGIGTTSPYAKLTVAGANNATAPLFVVTDTVSNATSTAFMVDQNGIVTNNSLTANSLTYSNATDQESSATVTGPLTFNSGALAINQATSFSNGYLSSTDWNTFNAKVSSTRLINTSYPILGGGDLSADRTISLAVATSTIALGSNLTTTSGALGYQLGGSNVTIDTVQNIATTSSPTFAGLTLTGSTANSILYANGTNQISSASITAPLVFSSGALSINQSNSFSDGYLSSTDWNTFNGKQAAITPGTGLSFTGNTLNSVWTSSGGNIFNNTGTNVGIGTTTPSGLLSVNATGAGTAPAFIVGSSSETLFSVSANGGVNVGSTEASSQAGQLFINRGGFSSVEYLGGAGSNGSNGIPLNIVNNGGSADIILNNQFNGFVLSGTTNHVGLASSTPWGQLSVNPTSALNGAPEFVVGSSSSAAHLIIDGSGAVGIGNNTPATNARRLDVEAPGLGGGGPIVGINVSDVPTSNAFIVKGLTLLDAGSSSATALAVFGRSGQSVPIFQVGSVQTSTLQGDYLTVAAAGNVGIGSTSPAAKLSVGGVAGGTAPLFLVSSSTAGFATSTAFMINQSGIVTNNSLTTNSLIYSNANDQETSASITAPLTFSGGALGISQAGSFGDGYLSSTDWNTFNNKQATITAGTGLSFSGATLNSVWTVNGSNIYNNNAANVGIGTTTPAFPLDVNGSASIEGPTLNIDTYGASLSSGNINFNGGRGYIGYNAGDSNLSIEGGSTKGIEFLVNQPTFPGALSSAAAVITTAGNVGIGTTSPTQALTIGNSGNVQIVGGALQLSTASGASGAGLTASGNGLYVQLTGTTNGFVPGSDNTQSLGLAGQRFSFLQVGTGTSIIGGTLGVGNPSASARLDVAGAAGSSANLFQVASVTSGFATTTRFKIDGNGGVAIGPNAPVLSGLTLIGAKQNIGWDSTTDNIGSVTFGKIPLIQLVGDGTSNDGPNIGLLQTNMGSTTGGNQPNQSASEIYLGATRGQTANAFDSVGNGDVLGRIGFYGADGTNDRTRAAQVQADATNAYQATSTGVVPAQLSLATSFQAPIAFFTNYGVNLGAYSNLSSALRVIIQPSGLVGIATSTPWGLLSVQATSTAGAPQFVVGSSAGTNLIVAGSGFVGLGTTTPAAQLSVNSSSLFNGVVNITANRIANNSGQLYIGQAGNNAGAISFNRADGSTQGFVGYDTGSTNGAFGIESNGGSGYLHFDTGASERVRIDNGGNVGIGTSSPTHILDVAQNTNGTALLDVTNANSGSSARVRVVLTNDGNSSGLLNLNGSQFTTDPNYLSLSSPSNVGTNTGLTFGTAGVERIRITGAGLTGIGTSTPAAVLDTYGSNGSGYAGSFTNASSASGANGLYVGLGSGAASSFGLRVDTALAGAIHSFVVNGQGNVGIGTTSPLLPLSVSSSATAQLGLFGDGSGTAFVGFAGNSGTLNNGRTYVGYDGTTGNAALQGIAGKGIEFNVNSSLFGSGTAAVITSAGNLGIGTTTPTNPLTLTAGTAAVPALSFGDTGTGFFRLSLSTLGVSTNGANVANFASYGLGVSELRPINSASANSDILLGNGLTLSHNNADANAALTVSQLNAGATGDILDLKNSNGIQDVFTQAGNFGIGTTSPFAKLTVGGASLGTTPLFAVSTSTATATTTVAEIDQNGNTLLGFNGASLGVGTAAPTAQLDTTGTVRFENFGAGTLTTDANGNLTVSSDERLKNITGAFTAGLDALNKLHPILYHWNSISGLDQIEENAGFSAQNVQSVIPDAVSVDPRGYLTLNERPILAATVNAVQELATTTDALSVATTSLDKRVTALEQKSSTSTTTLLTAQIADMSNQLANLQNQISTSSLAAAIAGIEATSTQDLSSTTIATAMQDLGILVEKGIAQFNTLVVRDLVFSKDADNSSAAGSGKIPGGQLSVTISNDHMLASSQVAVTLTSSLEGNWYVSNKQDGSFTVYLSEVQHEDVTFDYLIIQTQGQIATSTPVGAANVGSFSVSSWLASLFGGAATTSNTTTSTTAGTAGSSTSSTNSSTTSTSATTTQPDASSTPATDPNAPVVTILGGAALSLNQGDLFTDPGATAVDASNTDITSSIKVTGSVDTNTPGMYTLTYTATDSAGRTGSASRVVTVAAIPTVTTTNTTTNTSTSTSTPTSSAPTDSSTTTSTASSTSP